MRRRTRCARALLLVASALAACTREPVPDRDSATAATGTAIAIDATMAVPPSPADSGARDSITAPRPRARVRDTTTYLATADELAALGAALAIPVEGVRAADLRDTYTEARSGGRSHDAIDIPAPRGTPVLAAVDGPLERLHNSIPGGLMVYQGDATDRFVLMYGHLDRYADGLVEGAALRRGQIIGYVGTTGNAPAGTPHLHFAIARGRPSASWWRGTAVNPYPLLVGSAR